MPRWRLLRDGFLPPARNMAVDEAVFRLHPAGAWDATLRLYGWSPSALSLGYGQDAATACDEAACRARGVALVRRPTGGWAVLHADEVTYSVVSSSEGESFRGCGLAETYLRIARAFLAGVGALGVEAALVEKSEAALPARSAVPCFEVPSRHEVVSRDGRKLIGSAQRRLKRKFLQHGSVPLTLDRALLYAATGQAPRGEGEKFAALADVAPRPPSREALEGALVAAFAETFRARLDEGALTREEEALAGRLAREKYASDAWNRGRKEPFSLEA